MTRPLRVCIDARLDAGLAGGVQQFILGVARGFSVLDRSDVVWTFLGDEAARGWLAPALSSAQFACVGDGTDTKSRSSVVTAIRRAARPVRRSLQPGRVSPAPMVSELDADVVHFMTQQGFETDLPTLYHPYDLQHVHHPRLFSRADRGHRDDRYRALASRSIFTVAMTSWGARDLLQWLGASSPALAVVRPGASPSEFRPTGHTAPGRTLIYPARTWPHKNHEMLLRALARLDGDHADVTLVLTGSGTERGGLLYDVARSLGVEHRVTWLGYVSDERLAQLLVDAAALVFPSRFEGWGMPITEAMVLGTPVVCSDLPVLREVAGDAALYADPASVDGFVDAIRRVLSDRDLSVELVANGRARTEGLTWQEAASRLVALQLAVGGRTLDEEDRAAFERAVSEAAPLSS